MQPPNIRGAATAPRAAANTGTVMVCRCAAVTWRRTTAAKNRTSSCGTTDRCSIGAAGASVLPLPPPNRLVKRTQRHCHCRHEFSSKFIFLFLLCSRKIDCVSDNGAIYMHMICASKLSLCHYQRDTGLAQVSARHWSRASISETLVSRKYQYKCTTYAYTHACAHPYI